MPAEVPSGPLTDALPVVCVIAASGVVVVIVLAWLLHDVAARAIARCEPDQVAPVVLALSSLVSRFRWMWPWSDRERSSENDDTNQPAPGSQA